MRNLFWGYRLRPAMRLRGFDLRFYGVTVRGVGFGVIRVVKTLKRGADE